MSAFSCQILMILVPNYGISSSPDSILSLGIQSEVCKASNYDHLIFVKMSCENTGILTETGL